MEMKEALRLGASIQHMRSYIAEIYKEFNIEIINAEKSLLNKTFTEEEKKEIISEVESLRSHVNLIEDLIMEYNDTFHEYYFDHIEQNEDD